MLSFSIPPVSTMPDSLNSIFLSLLLVLAATSLVFVVFPSIDIAVSALFYREVDGFWLNGNAVLDGYRNVFNIVSISLAVLSLVFWGVSAFRGAVLTIPGRVWAFITGLYVLGPGLLVNGLLKEYSGRARPAYVDEFGGEQRFTPAFQFTDQCDGNCSFVSGEGSGATAFFIAVLVLSSFITSRVQRRVVIGIGLAAALLAAALRIAKGRHFLSDTLLSMLFIALIAVLLSFLLLRKGFDGPQQPAPLSGATPSITSAARRFRDWAARRMRALR